MGRAPLFGPSGVGGPRAWTAVYLTSLREYPATMILCPVCESQQAQGLECEVCGLAFPASALQAAGIAPPIDPATPPPSPDGPCVYCGHVQPGGAVCDRCGMQRNRGARPAAAPAAATDPDEPPLGRCRACEIDTHRARCPNCGGRLTYSEDE